MRTLEAQNVNHALPKGLMLLHRHGEVRDSRNGQVRVSPVPVTTVYGLPQQRVIFDETRDANPFFHLFESLWMLSGRNDLAYVEQFAKNMRNYSDDGETMWGAYGWRWRSFFGFDQIAWAIKRLTENPDDRRVVVQMWDARADPYVADSGGRDVPCNTQLQFQVSTRGQLDMMVFNRSNDIIWGAYGANAVHFSILQEYVASALGIPIGQYWQISCNYHAYEDLYQRLLPMAREYVGGTVESRCPYREGEVEPWPLMTGTNSRTWNEDLMMFLDEPGAIGSRHSFFRKVAKPMFMAHRAYRDDSPDTALEILHQMPLKNDWRRAAIEWVERRKRGARS